jgi:hypothetical protein
MTIYHIDITNGTMTYDYAPTPKTTNEHHALNAKQYFEHRGKTKPKAITVKGWPFKKIYLTHGTDENGQAVAWN